MWDTIGELWIQTRNATAFRVTIVCVLTLVTQKVQVVCWCSTYPMTALLWEMFIFYVRGGCKILMAARYASKCASQTLSYKPFCVFSALRHITWKLQAICGSIAYCITSILSETFIVWFRVIPEIQLESYDPRQALVVLRYIQHCARVYCKSVYTSLFGTQLCLTTKLTYLMTAYMYYTPNRGFTANNASFYKSKVG